MVVELVVVVLHVAAAVAEVGIVVGTAEIEVEIVIVVRVYHLLQCSDSNRTSSNNKSCISSYCLLM